MSTLQVVNAKHPSSASNNIVLDSSGNATFAGTAVPASSFLRNRIINGDMRIDQRNAGASGTSNGYTVDRFAYFGSQSSRGTWQQNAASVTPPAGFTNYLGFTSSSAYSVLSTDEFEFYQSIEGLNIADLGWGTANAQTVTLSFWVRSSLTGTFGGALGNSAGNRSYPYTYTISAANTWERKTVTIPGDTSGTWLTTNGIGIAVYFGLGVGTSKSGTAGAWAGSYFPSATGATSVVGTNGATFYLTGVQLEVGSVATPFERRQYGTELSLCQRYFSKSFNIETAPASNAGGTGVHSVVCVAASTYTQFDVRHPVTMRASPTVTTYNPGAAGNQARNTDTGADCSFTGADSTGQSGFRIATVAPAGSGAGNRIAIHWTSSAEL